MRHFKLNQAQLAETLGVERATVSKMFKTGTNPRAENLQSLVRALPAISLDWLIMGEGEMLRTAPASLQASKQDTPTT